MRLNEVLSSRMQLMLLKKALVMQPILRMADLSQPFIYRLMHPMMDWEQCSSRTRKVRKILCLMPVESFRPMRKICCHRERMSCFGLGNLEILQVY